MTLELRPSSEVRWDLVALGEVMLRLDPGDEWDALIAGAGARVRR